MEINTAMLTASSVRFIAPCGILALGWQVEALDRRVETTLVGFAVSVSRYPDAQRN